MNATSRERRAVYEQRLVEIAADGCASPYEQAERVIRAVVELYGHLLTTNGRAALTRHLREGTTDPELWLLGGLTRQQ
jgi:hypothetical protein